MGTVLILASVACMSAAATPGPWIGSSDYTFVVVITPEKADPQTTEAADLFAEYWEKCTGEPVVRKAAPQASGLNVWIGASTVPEAWEKECSLSSLKRDGICIETKAEGKRKDLILAGGPGRGTVYAVYEFFEKAFGVRWLTPDDTDIPKAPDHLAAMHVRYEPQFSYRETGLPSGANRDTYRNNSKFIYGIRGHSLYTILPPDKYFAEHPEYYSELNGKRVAPVGLDWHAVGFGGEHPDVAGQLCMTNPDTAKAIANELEAILRKNPNANVLSVSQMDWGGYCTCPVCRALDEEEGSPAASMLVGVNRVAELVEKDFPGTYIQTYAYTWTRKPPKTIRPRRNVIIQLCTFECDFARTLDDPTSDVNAAFLADLRGWQKLDANIIFYDYPNNCDNLTKPYPNFHVIGPYIRTFAKNNGIGVYEQGHGGRLCALGYLRPYLFSKLMWDPSLDTDAVIDDFLKRYYGSAAPYLRQYIDLSRDTLLASQMPMYLFDTCAWITPEYVNKSVEIFQKAFEAADNDTIRDRVDLAYFPVQYSGFLSRPTVEMNNDALIATFPVTLSKEALRQRMTDLGLDAIWPGDWPTIQTMFDRMYDCNGTDPVRIPLVRIENDRYAVWTAPLHKGTILRWQDKVTGAELLKGYETAGMGRGTWQDWTDRNTNGEGPAADSYSVVERTDRRVVLEAHTPDGLKIQRTMETPEGDGPLAITLRVTNESDAPQDGRVKSHPEFYCQQPRVQPEIWMKKAKEWTLLTPPTTGPLAADFLPVTTPLEWGFYIPDKQIGLLCSVKKSNVGQLLYFYDTHPGVEQINLELMPERTVLAPGESRTLSASYAIITARPE